MSKELASCWFTSNTTI